MGGGGVEGSEVQLDVGVRGGEREGEGVRSAVERYVMEGVSGEWLVTWGACGVSVGVWVGMLSLELEREDEGRGEGGGAVGGEVVVGLVVVDVDIDGVDLDGVFC